MKQNVSAFSGKLTVDAPWRSRVVSWALVVIWLGGAMCHSADVTVVKTATPPSVSPGGTVSHTVTVTNTSNPTKTLTNVTISDPLDPNGNTNVTGTVQVSPVAVDDAYAATGNVSLDVPVASGLLATDYLGAGPVATITAFDAASTSGGVVSVTTSGANAGAFTYSPPRGFTGADTFHYTLTNTAGSDIGTVTITVSNMIWFIDNNAAAGGNGRLSAPYNSIASFNAVQGMAGNNPKAGDAIFLYRNTATAYAGGFTLLNNQRLIGQGVALDAASLGFTPAPFSVPLPTAISNPTLSNASGNGVTLASGNALIGLDIGNCPGNVDIMGSNFGTLTVSAVGLIGTGRPLNLATGTLAATFTGITSTSASGGQGISLSSVAGSMTVTNGTSITGSTTQGILVTGSTANINFGNTLVSGGTNQVSLQNNSAGTRTFGTLSLMNGTGATNSAFLHTVGGGLTVVGTTTITNPPANGAGIDIQNSTTLITFGDTSISKSTAGAGVNLVSNSGGVTFTSLAITSGGGSGLVGSENSGTITVTNPTGTLSATGGPVLSITKTTASTPLAMSLGTMNCFASATQGVNLQRVSGTLTSTGGNIGTSIGAAFVVSNSTANITYAGGMSQNAGQRVVDIQNNTAGTITLGGSVTSTGGTGLGVLLNANTGATINFTGVINLLTNANPAFTATGGGTISATNTTSSLSTTTATALTVANTAIGASGLTFKSISANGAASAIVLNATSGGELKVNGDGSGTANGTGGTITNATTRAVDMLTAGGTVTLKSMNVAMNTSAFNGMFVDNTAGGTLAVNVIGCTFTGVTASVAQNKALLHVSTGGSANVTANVQNCYFNSSRTYGFAADAIATSLLNVTVNQCGFGTDVNSGPAVNQPGTTITNPPVIGMLIQNSGSAQVDYVVSNNTFWGASGALGALYAVGASGAATTATSHNNGSWTGNKIGKTGVVGSGASGNAAGMGFFPGTQGTFKATITGNDIRQVNNMGINIANSAGGGATIAGVFKIKGNTFAEPDTTGSPSFQRAITLSPGNSSGANTPWAAEIGDTTGAVPANKNSISGAWQAGAFIRITNANNTAVLTLPGLTPAAGATDTQVNTFVSNANTLPANSVTATGSTAGIVGGAALPLLAERGGVQAAAGYKDAVTPSASSKFPQAMRVQNSFVQKALQHSPTLPDPIASVNAAALPTPPREPSPGGFVTRSLTQEQLKPIVAAAFQRWTDAGLTDSQIALLQRLIFEVKPLSSGYLGAASLGSVAVSENGAGFGWYVDLDPLDDSEFTMPSGATRFYTESRSLPAGRIDLLTTVMHEMGHQLGLRDSHKLADRDNLMFASLTMGERRLPAKGQAKGAVPHLAFGDVEYLFTPIVIPTLPPGKAVVVKFDVAVSNPLVPATTTSISNTASVSGANITGSPIASNTVTTTINTPPTSFTAGGPPPASGDLGVAYAGYTFIANGGPAPTYALSPTSNPLPGGLTLSAAGVLSGANPNAAGTFAGIVVRATNVSGMIDTAPFTITINPALSIAPAALNAATAGSVTTRTMTVSNGTKPYLSLTTSGFNAGTTGLAAGALSTNPGAGTVTLNGTPNAAGTASFNVNVTDTVGAPLTKNYSLTVNAPLTILPAALTAATAGTAKNQVITVSGGTTPYTTFTVSGFNAGTTGLTMGALTTNSAAGTVTLNGTPTAAGSAAFTVNVTDTAGAALTKNYSLTVNTAPSISPPSLNAVLVSTSTNQTMTVTNGTKPYTTFMTSGFNGGTTGLTAAALSTNAAAGTVTISGTPSALGTASFTVDVTDTAGATLSKNYTLTVSLITITPGSLAQATTGTLYNRTITVNNAQLPLLTLNATGFSAGGTGLTMAMFAPNLAAGSLVINGTPTTAGTATFTVNVTDGANTTITQNYSLTVNPVPSIAPANLAQATAGSVTVQTMTVSNGTAPYTNLSTSAFNAGTTGLPLAALSANAGAGTVTLNGTPTSAGSATFTVNVTDTAGATVSKNYTLTVNAAISAAPAALAQATAGKATTQAITLSNGTKPYTNLSTTAFISGGTGLAGGAVTTNLGAGTFTLNGTPTAAGTASFNVNGTDTAGALFTQNYSLTVNPAIVVLPATLPNGTVFAAYSQALSTTGGTGAITFARTAGTLPAGLTLDGATGAISGTPTASGTFNFTITATDSVTATGQKAYSINVAPPAIAVAPATLTAGNVGAAYSAQFTASGGVAPYTFTINSGALPPGVLLAGDGALSGAPTANGTFNFVVRAADASGAPGPYSGTQAVSLSIGPATIALAPAALPDANTGAPYNQTLSASGGTAPYTFAVTAGTLPPGLSLSAAGVISGSAAAPGLASFTITATDSSTGTGPFTGSAPLTLQVLNAAIAITSGPAAVPNPAGVAQTVTFAVSATGGAGALTYTWNFGDGSPAASGATATHSFAAASSYSVTVTVTDTIGGSASGSVQVTVNAPLIGTGSDSDGDGYSDAFESAVGLDSTSAASTPTGSPVTATTGLTISKAAIKLNFAKSGNDSIAFSGTIDVPAGFVPLDAKVYFDVSGVAKILTLTAKGSAKNGNDSAKISIKAKKGVVAAQTSKYSVAFKKGNFATALAAAGLTSADAKSAPITVPFTFIFNAANQQSPKSMLYTAKAGKSGSAK